MLRMKIMSWTDKISVAALLLFAAFASHAQDIRFDRVDPGDSRMGPITGSAICQDKYGVLWVGTREGLFSYDGLRLTRHDPLMTERSRGENQQVNMVQRGGDDRIYMLVDRRLVVYDCDAERFSQPDSSSYTILAPASAGVWCGYRNTVWNWSGLRAYLFITLDSPANIMALHEGADKLLYIGTDRGEVYRIDRNRKMSLIYHAPANDILAIYTDSRKNLWIGTSEQGVVRIDNGGQVSDYLHSKSDPQTVAGNNIRAICEDLMGDLWIGTMTGISKFSFNTNRFVNYGTGHSGSPGLPNSSVWSLYRDNQGTIWGGTYFGGLFCFNPAYDIYNYMFVVSPSDHQPILGQILKDKRGDYWIATEGNGLLSYRPGKNEYKFLVHDQNNPNSVSHNNIKRIYYERERDRLWICTHQGGLCRLDIAQGRFQKILDPAHPQLDNVTFRDIVPYRGKFIAATHTGLYILDPASNRFTPLLKGNHSRFASLYIDPQQNLWAGENENLYVIDLPALLDRGEEKVEILDNSHGLRTPNNVISMYADGRNNLWIGYEEKGLDRIDLQSRRVTSYDSFETGMRGNSISAIAESGTGYLLVATEYGLSLLDTESKKAYNYLPGNGFPLRSMAPGGIYVEENGVVLLSGNNGLVGVPVDKLLFEPAAFRVRFNTLAVNNAPVAPGDGSGLLSRSLFTTPNLTLSHSENLLRIGFISDNFIKANQIDYQYRLEGFDSGWMPAPENRMISYTNLSPGRYTLRVRGADVRHPANFSETALGITILPPFWKTWWAYLLYAVVAGLAIWRLAVFNRSKMLLKAKLLIERNEKKLIERTNQSKLKFFINISHEFRTPVTLILGQLQLLQESPVSFGMKKKLTSIYANALQMQGLIDELLDFSKQEQGFLKIKVREHDIVDFSREIFDSFSEYAAFRQIEFTFDSAQERIMVWFDAKQMQKVLYNLISNAFKYTDKGGIIRLSISLGHDRVFISVSDTGVGIPPGEVKHIFDCYYQVENLDPGKSFSPGSGIGLSLAKGIVEAHHGTITVETMHHKGSVFTAELELGEEHFADDKNVVVGEDYSLNTKCMDMLAEDEQTVVQQTRSAANSLHSSTILVVEDNQELRQMIARILSEFAAILEAENGEEGFAIAKERQPDLIISDVMMPVMSGFEMCSKLKTDFDTSHIPVILLTAYTTVEHRIEGFRNGADDYLTKPFNTRLLVTRSNNLLHSRRMLREKYMRQPHSAPYNIVTSNSLDQSFIDKAVAVVEEHLGSDAFTSKQFAREMTVSQTSLYNKLKAITGQSISEFVLSIRLNRTAKALIEEPAATIAEIAYRLGFCDPKYFTKCFKAQFGVTPTEYRKREGAQTPPTDTTKDE